MISYNMINQNGQVDRLSISNDGLIRYNDCRNVQMNDTSYIKQLINDIPYYVGQSISDDTLYHSIITNNGTFEWSVTEQIPEVIRDLVSYLEDIKQRLDRVITYETNDHRLLIHCDGRVIYYRLFDGNIPAAVRPKIWIMSDIDELESLIVQEYYRNPSEDVDGMITTIYGIIDSSLLEEYIEGVIEDLQNTLVEYKTFDNKHSISIDRWNVLWIDTPNASFSRELSQDVMNELESALSSFISSDERSWKTTDRFGIITPYGYVSWNDNEPVPKSVKELYDLLSSLV